MYATTLDAESLNYKLFASHGADGTPTNTRVPLLTLLNIVLGIGTPIYLLDLEHWHLLPAAAPPYKLLTRDVPALLKQRHTLPLLALRTVPLLVLY